MGMFENVTKMAGMMGVGGDDQSKLLQGVMGLLGPGGSGGGLTGLIGMFNQKGLGSLMSSWVGTGENLPISAEQITQGLGTDRLTQVAQSAGLSEGATASALASMLPGIIDKLTPGGQLPKEGGMDQMMASLKGLLGS